MWDIDEIIVALRTGYPGIRVEQLQVINRGADDDGLWFFTHPGCPYEVQLEAADGNCPFLIETNENDERFMAATREEALRTLRERLHLQAGDP